MRDWTQEELAELSNLFHLASTALAGTRPTRADRRRWAAREFAKAHPEVSSLAALKQLERDDAWRHAGR